jgi:phosphohistidine phosphatase SixA
MSRYTSSPIVDRCRVLLLLSALIAVPASFGDSLSGKDLLAALRTGGYVILMRHASSPREPPDVTAANPDNKQLERQLDEAGRSSARNFSEALRHLKIPIGEVLSSPTYRALETIKLAELSPVTTFPQLGDSGQSMMVDKTGSRGAWLKAKSAESPARGRNTLIVTHFPNIMEAFPQDIAGLADGEALILHPDGRGGTQVITRVKIEEWSRLESVH